VFSRESNRKSKLGGGLGDRHQKIKKPRLRPFIIFFAFLHENPHKLNKKKLLEEISGSFFYENKDSLVVIFLIIVIFFIHIEIHHKVKTL